MKWLTFALAAYAALLLQAAFAPVWTIRGLSPAPLLVLAVFIAQSGPATLALGSAMFLGVLADTLSRPYPEAGVLLGPYTVGYAVAAYAVLQLRNLVFRHSVPAVVAMTLVAGCFAELVAVGLITLRGVSFLAADPPPGWRALGELGRRFLQTLYTAALTIPVGWALLRSRKLWHFGQE